MAAAGEQKGLKAMSEIYTVHNPRTNRHQQFADPKQAGAAFFIEERSDRPAVIHSQDDPGAPGGRFARLMANTRMDVTQIGGMRFIKTLPNSHKSDAEFRAGYMEALEISVKERLKQVASGNLDKELSDDLKELEIRRARVSQQPERTR